MSKSGFVYVLTNAHMPGVFKLGCTERSPHDRAAELSMSTGVPAPFEVLCYVECNDFQKVERHMHELLSTHRVNSAREFFDSQCLRHAIALLYWHPWRRAFTVPDDPHKAPHARIAYLHGFDPDFFSMADSINPFAEKARISACNEMAKDVIAQAMSSPSGA